MSNFFTGNKVIYPLRIGNPLKFKMSTIANSEDPDEMLHKGSALFAKTKSIRERNMIFWKLQHVLFV